MCTGCMTPQMYERGSAQWWQSIIPREGSSEWHMEHTGLAEVSSALQVQAVTRALVRVLPPLTMAAAMRAHLQQVGGFGLGTP